MLINKKIFNKTCELLNGFNFTLKTLLESENQESILVKVQIDSTKSFIRKLTAQIAEYENLQKEVVMIESKEITQLSDILINARIANGWSQKELAVKLNLAEQQIQRYEITDYAGASFVKMVDVAMALGLNLKFESFTITKDSFEEKFMGYRYAEIYVDKVKKSNFNLVA